MMKMPTFPKIASISRRAVAFVPSGRFPIQKCLAVTIGSGTATGEITKTARHLALAILFFLCLVE